MRRVRIFGHDTDSIIPLVRSSGFEIDPNDPDFIISYGGDGTLIGSEAHFPGIPKIVLKNSNICKKCSHLSNEEVLLKVRDGRYLIEESIKLEATVGDKRLIAINEIIVHNSNPRKAIRYTVHVDNKQIASEIIGDGIVVATPSFGSTGYYRSITDSFFEVGIGLAFNNSTEQSDHMVLRNNRIIKLDLIRGPADVYADNQESAIELREGECVTIKKSEETAKIVIPRE